MPAVRRRLTGAQRSFAEKRNVVMAGRDIGSVVLPEARFKFYLTADLETRVRRRVEQLAPRGIQISIEAMRQEILARDARDISRTISPRRIPVASGAPRAIERQLVGDPPQAESRSPKNRRINSRARHRAPGRLITRVITLRYLLAANQASPNSAATSRIESMTN